MASPIVKQPFEVIPVDFRFTGSLGPLEPDLVIESVDSIFAAPSGDPDDLDFGDPLDWAIEGLVVQPIVSNGRHGVTYKATCRINVVHAITAKHYKFELDGSIVVRER